MGGWMEVLVVDGWIDRTMEIKWNRSSISIV